MAGLIIRNGTYYAIFSLNGKQIRKTTKIPEKPNGGTGTMTARQLKALALQTAEGMERTAKGNAAALSAAIAALEAFGGKATCPTVAAYFKTYQAQKPNLKNLPKALDSFARLMPKAMTLPLDSVTAAMAEDYVQKALDEVSGSTVDRRLADLTAVWNRAIREEICKKNPFTGIRVPKWAIQPHERAPFTRDELKIILTTFPGEWPDMVASCLLLGGLRLGETACLKWDQVDFFQNLLRLQTSKTKRRMVKPIVAPLQKILARRRAAHGETSPYIFPYAGAVMDCNGGNSSKLSLEFGKLCREAGISRKLDSACKGEKVHKLTDKTFHSLRATATTFLLDLGTPAELVRYIVGHDDAEIERRHYYKPSPETSGTAISAMAAALGLDSGSCAGL